MMIKCCKMYKLLSRLYTRPMISRFWLITSF